LNVASLADLAIQSGTKLAHPIWLATRFQYDPACGSGGMFVQAEAHQRCIDGISIYGQESNYRLCRMNLAIRGIDGSN